MVDRDELFYSGCNILTAWQDRLDTLIQIGVVSLPYLFYCLYQLHLIVYEIDKICHCGSYDKDNGNDEDEGKASHIPHDALSAYFWRLMIHLQRIPGFSMATYRRLTRDNVGYVDTDNRLSIILPMDCYFPNDLHALIIQYDDRVCSEEKFIHHLRQEFCHVHTSE